MKYKRVLLDTNLFIVFVIGTYDIKLIPKVKRLAAYTENDYTIIKNIVENSEKIIITNSIISETCNLLDSINKSYDMSIFTHIAKLITNAHDHTIKLNENIKTDAFNKFGFTDAEVFNISETDIDCMVFTDDLSLYHYISNKSGQVCNINHLRLNPLFG